MSSIKEKVINNVVYSYDVFNHIEDLEQKNIRLRNRVKELLKDCNSCNFHKYKQALEKIKNIAELEVMFDKNSKVFYPTNIQRILDVINEVLNDRD